MAARRVVPVSRENSGLTCPTRQNRPIESVGENPLPSNKKSRSNLGKHMKLEHKRMSRMLGYCLTLGTPDAWCGFKVAAAARLSDAERAALAFSCLNALEDQHAHMTAAAAMGSAGVPLPAMLGGMEEARSWAACATRQELKAFALAAFEAMNAADQAAFFQHIREMEIAA